MHFIKKWGAKINCPIFILVVSISTNMVFYYSFQNSTSMFFYFFNIFIKTNGEVKYFNKRLKKSHKNTPKLNTYKINWIQYVLVEVNNKGNRKKEDNFNYAFVPKGMTEVLYNLCLRLLPLSLSDKPYSKSFSYLNSISERPGPSNFSRIPLLHVYLHAYVCIIESWIGIFVRGLFCYSIQIKCCVCILYQLKWVFFLVGYLQFPLTTQCYWDGIWRIKGN